ncbi:MAG: ANTAR domain-containing response regulator, partial [Panacagrimonas sp.]
MVQPRARVPQGGASSSTPMLDSTGNFPWHATCELRAMRVLVVDESAERGELLRAALAPAGYEVTALSSPLALLKTIETLEPDVIVIDTDSPSRDVLEHLVMTSRHTPRPVVMFAADGTPVSAYVVNG